MKEQQGGSRKKFLYDDHKKSKKGVEERQFHSRGYDPSQKTSVIDLESVWSVKNIVLDSPTKANTDTDTQVKANTSYYSRHGQYKTNADKMSLDGISPSPSRWNAKAETSRMGKSDPFQSNNSNTDPLDF